MWAVFITLIVILAADAWQQEKKLNKMFPTRKPGHATAAKERAKAK